MSIKEPRMSSPIVNFKLLQFFNTLDFSLQYDIMKFKVSTLFFYVLFFNALNF